MNRNCPNCGAEQVFESKFGFDNAVKNNRLCRKCSKTGNKNPSFGIVPSSETKEKISNFHIGKPKSKFHRKKLSESLIGKTIGIKNGFYGKHHSENTKQYLSNLQKGSKSFKFNKPLSDETKRKMRVAILKRMERTGIAPCRDVGSEEFFHKMNNEGFNFKPKKFIEIGYEADGYDEEKHIWCEFDTPHHNKTYKKEKDLVRQQNIITYFERINNPLNSFIRVSANKTGEVLEVRTIYKGVL